MKKYSTIGLVFVIVGSFIGAGFASGKEIANYFARHKLLGLFFAILLGVVFYFFILKSLTIGKNLKNNNHSNLYTTVFGKAGAIIKAIVITACFILVGTMIAGNASLLAVSFSKYNVVIINIVILVLVGIIVSKGYKLVAQFNLVLLPLIITTIMAVCILFLKSNTFNWLLFKKEHSFILALFNSVEYMSFNLMATGVFLIEIGKHYTYKQIKTASAVASATISFFVFFIAFTLIIGGNILTYDLPIISMALTINKNFVIPVSVVMFFALVTSLITSAYTINSYLNKFFKSNILSIIFILAVGFVISTFGFSFIVVNFYSAIGLFGLFFVICLARIKT